MSTHKLLISKNLQVKKTAELGTVKFVGETDGPNSTTDFCNVEFEKDAVLLFNTESSKCFEFKDEYGNIFHYNNVNEDDRRVVFDVSVEFSASIFNKQIELVGYEYYNKIINLDSRPNLGKGTILLIDTEDSSESPNTGDVTLILPYSNTKPGIDYRVVKSDNSKNKLVVMPQTGDFIDSDDPNFHINLTEQYDRVMLMACESKKKGWNRWLIV
jgi:hypothetical protein